MAVPMPFDTMPTQHWTERCAAGALVDGKQLPRAGDASDTLGADTSLQQHSGSGVRGTLVGMDSVEFAAQSMIKTADLWLNPLYRCMQEA